MKREVERRYIPVSDLKVERRSDGYEKPKISGYAAVFGKWSEDLGGFREKIAPGAFTKALKGSDPRALFNHDANHVLGRQSAGTLILKEDKKGLFMEIDPPDTQCARDLMVSIDRGDITQQSFGFYLAAEGDEWAEDKKTGAITRTITEVEELLDVSPVTYPAYPDTDVALRSLDKFKETNELPAEILDEEIGAGGFIMTDVAAAAFIQSWQRTFDDFIEKMTENITAATGEQEQRATPLEEETEPYDFEIDRVTNLQSRAGALKE